MIFVLLVHYNWPLNGRLTSEMFHQSAWKYIGCATLDSLDFVCVNCFIIISGYFGIKWKWNGLAKFLFQIGFWGGIIHLIASTLGLSVFNIVTMLKQMTLFLFGVNWFFIAYLGLYLFAPVLNAFIEKSSEKQLGIFVLAFYVFQTLFGWITSESADIHSGMSTFSFVGLYMLGAYLKKSTLPIFQWKAKWNLMVYLGIAVLSVIISVCAASVGFNHSIFGYITPLNIIQTAYLFLFCKAVKIKKGEKVILFFSSSAFAALLMHSWTDGSNLYYTGLYWIYDTFKIPFFAAMAYILLFFVTACCIDKIRIFCWNKLAYLIDKK